MTSTLARTALHNKTAPRNRAVELAEAPLRGMIALRGNVEGAAMADAVRAAVDLSIPAQRRFEGDGETRVLWMAPDELMVQVPIDQAPAAVRALETGLAGTPHLALDLSDARTILSLRGQGAREVLAKGAPVDLHRSAFGVGDVRRTRIGAVAAAFYQISDEPETFELFCFRSYAPYLWDWLAASSKPGALPGVL